MLRIVAYLLKIRPGKEAAYIETHREVWPELIALLKKVGFRNLYTIFRRGLDLFMYVEVGNFEKSLNMLMNDPLYERWAEKRRESWSPIPIASRVKRFLCCSEVFHVD